MAQGIGGETTMHVACTFAMHNLQVGVDVANELRVNNTRVKSKSTSDIVLFVTIFLLDKRMVNACIFALRHKEWPRATFQHCTK